MKLHLPSGLRAAVMACFAAVSTVIAPPISATMAGGIVAVTFLCAASPAMAEAVTWDSNWNVTDAPADIPDSNVLSAVPSGFSFLSENGSAYISGGQTVVHLNGTAPDATNVNVIAGAGATSGSTSESEGPLTADTWMKVTSGTYATLVGGSYAQNYAGGALASFTGDSHILLTTESGASSAPVVDYIIGGNYMDAQSAPFTGNSYISVESGTVNGSIVGGGTSAHIQKAIFNGNSSIWVYTPLSGSAAARFELPGNFIIGGNAAINNFAPRLEQTGNSQVSIDLSSYTPAGSTGMDKSIVGGAWLLNNTTSTHTGNTMVSIIGTAADGSNVSFSQPVVAGSWFAGSGTASLSGNTELNVTGGEYAGALVGGAYMAADGTASSTMGNATLSLNGGSYAGNIIGGSFISQGSAAATQQTGDISLTLSSGSVSGNIYGGSYTMRDNAQSVANHGAVSISLMGGTITGDVYAGGGVAAGVQGGVMATSTQVEVADSVTLGSTGAGITISGGVENSNAASGVSGNRTLLLSGSNYTNLDNATFYDFNIVNNASDVTLKLREIANSFTKAGAGTLTINGADSNLNPIAELTVQQGVLNTGTAWLTRDNQGLTSISVGAGASLVTEGLLLADAATLSLDITNATAGSALININGAGGLTVAGQKTLALTLLGVESLAGGSSVELLSWNTPAAPFDLANVTWTNKAPGMEAYELNLSGNTLTLSRAESLEWEGGNGTWNASGSEWDGQTGVSSDGKAVTFDTPAGGSATVSISGDVAPQSIVVNNAAGSTYTFEQVSGGSGAITGDSTLTKENGGTLKIALANTYTQGTTVNGGTLDAAAQGALGSGAVTLNAGGTLLVSAENAVAANELVLNGGNLSYTADETRDLGAAGITQAGTAQASISVAEGNTVTWQYADAALVGAAMANGLQLSGGGTLKVDSTTATTVAALTAPITLTGQGTTLELGSLGAKQLGSAANPMAISLGQGSTLRVQRPDSATASTIQASLTGNGTLEFAADNAAAGGTVQLTGNNAAFAGEVNLGSAGAASTAPGTDSAAVLLDFSQGSPVGATLNLNGLGFAAIQSNGTTASTAAAINLNANTTQYAQTAGLDTTFTGALTGAAGTSWILNATGVTGGQTNTLAGDLSGMEGTLEAIGQAGSISRWVLGSGETSEPTVTPFAVTPSTSLAVSLSAPNEYNEFVLNYAQDVVLAGAVSGQANLTQQGTGTLVLTGDNDSSGTLTIAEGSTVQLGLADDAGQWGNAAGSTLAGNGTLTLVNGTLNGPLTVEAGSTPTINAEIAAGGNVNFNGNSAALINGSLTIGDGGTLTGVAAGSIERQLDFTLGQSNIGSNAAATALVQFENGGAGSSLGSTTETITLDLSNAGVIDVLRQQRAAGVESFLTLTNGELITAADYSNVSFGQNMDILSGLGLRIARTQDGSVVLSGAAQGVYIAGAGEDATEVTGYQNFGAYQAVAVMPGETLTLTLDGAPDPALDGAGATINNLLGAENSALVLNNTNTAGETAVVILNNTVQPIDPVPEGLPGDPVGANTSFGGSISQSSGDVELVKTGAGTLSVGGSLTVQQLTVQGGTIALDGTGNTLGELTMDGGNADIGNGTTTTAETLSDTANGGRISVGQGATLVTTGTGRLENAVVGSAPDNSGGDITPAAATGAGTLQVTGNLQLANEARLDGVALDAAGGTLTLDGTSGHSVTALNGNGTIEGIGTAETVGLDVTGTGGSFAGTLAGNGTLTVAAGAGQTFTSDFSGGAGWNLANNGLMTLDFVQENGSNSGSIALNALTLGAGSTTGMNINTDAPVANLLTLGSIAVAPTATVNLSAAGAENLVTADTSYTIGSVSGGQPAGVLTTLTPDAANVVFMLLDAERSTLTVEENGDLRLNLVTSRTNKLIPLASNTNSAAGANMLWNAAFNGNTAVGTDIRRVLESLNTGMRAGSADRLLAAASGASNAVLSAAFSSDMERQLRAIRNRTTMMTGKARTGCKGQLASDGPRFAAWINGEGDHRKMKADGFLPGYSLSSWGGTLGMDMSCNENFVGGLALTAMYGDLDAHSADNATGDFDRYYISAFSRLKSQRWQHTLLGSVGRLDADLDRTVNFGTGSYRTHGDTKGWGYGLMYEIGYDLPVDEDARFTLQPIANVTWRYVDLDGYTERGSDAGLRVDGQDYNTVTFGAGLRTRGQVGECWFNRSALLEARALVKVDTGDRHGEARVAMLGGGGLREKVRSAKLEAVGVELGAGLSIPLGSNNGAFFIDGSAELRNEYSNLNGTVGYRMEF